MKRWINRVATWGAAAACALLVVAIMGCLVARQWAVYEAERDFPPPGRLIAFEGRVSHIHCIGSGSPTILLESGLDDRGSWTWRHVHEDLAEISRTCAYDRAGMMWSESREEPRDAKRIADELHALLAGASESPPYVLVGHSVGGVLLRVYDHEYPGEAVGFVLVDASHPEQQDRFPDEVRERIREADSSNPPRWMFRILAPLRVFAPERPTPRTAYWWRSFPEGVLGEVAAIDATFLQSQATGDLGGRPLVVLTSGVKPVMPDLSAEVNADFQRTLMSLQEELAGLSMNSEHRVIEGSGHYIQQDRPGAVVQAVRDVVTAVRNDHP